MALTGIVVNDSLVLVTYVNKLRDHGRSLIEAVGEGASARFRAIILTSLTTAAGVMPLMLEKEVQAQFLIPMAVALVYGVLFSTAITLVLVPSCYLILEDFRRLFEWWWREVTEKPALASASGVAAEPLLEPSNGASATLLGLEQPGRTAEPDDQILEEVGSEERRGFGD